jgi:putative flippase GtrA
MKLKELFDRKLLKFIFVGILNTIIGSAIMFSFYNLLNFSYWLASASNIVLVSILSFFLNKYFTFNVKQWSFFMVIAFIMTIAISYFLAYGVSRPLVKYFLKDSSKTIRENIALFIGMCMFTGINYLGQRLIVFREKEVV